jgi:hypothetical protein
LHLVFKTAQEIFNQVFWLREERNTKLAHMWLPRWHISNQR